MPSSPAGSAEPARRFVAAVDDGNVAAMDAMCHPEAEFRPYLAELTGRPYRGPAAISDWYAEAGETFSEIDLKLLRVVELDDQRAIALCHNRQRERSTGVDLETDVAVAMGFREGKVVWARVFPTEAEAREGLSPGAER